MPDQNRQLFEVRNLSEFLQNCLRREILNYELEPLTKPGDNYGSVMQSVTVEVAGKSDYSEVNIKTISWIYYVYCKNYLLLLLL